MKSLLIDIETAYSKVGVFSLWNQNIGINQILENGYTLCWAAKWLNKRGTMFSSIWGDGREVMIRRVHDLLSEADTVIHQNGERFDVPTLNTEFLLEGLSPPSPFKQIDILKTSRRKFKFPSNKLDYVAKALGFEGKVEHEGFRLWTKCMEGDTSAQRRMMRYNKRDVVVLEEIYNKMLPWIKNHPNVNLFTEQPTDDLQCPKCGSDSVQRRGYYYGSVYRYQRFQCNDCGAWSRERLKDSDFDATKILSTID